MTFQTISAFDFDIIKRAIRKIVVDKIVVEEPEPANVRHMAYQMARALCPNRDFSEEMIDALIFGAHEPNEAFDEA